MDKEDLLKYRQLKSIISNGKFDIKGDAVIMVASLFAWFNNLEDKIKLAIEKPLENAVITMPEESPEESSDGDQS